jgi:hypothetical protein
MTECFELKTTLNDILLCKCATTYHKILQNNKIYHAQQRTEIKSHAVIFGWDENGRFRIKYFS